MAKSTADLIKIMRNVTGRVDASDPQFTDAIMLGYLNDFMNLEFPQEIRINQQMSWWEFTRTVNDPNPMPVDLQAPFGTTAGTSFTTIGPTAYVDGFQMWWYQNPQEFYYVWPETQEYSPTRPVDVLYYNNQLTFRAPMFFDATKTSYDFKINCYKAMAEIVDGGTIETDYLWRYICYGASLDMFSDYGEMDKWNQIWPVFTRYKAIVYARTYQQNMNQRTTPRF